MAPRKTRPTKARKTKPAARRPKTRRVFTQSSEDDVESSSEAREAGGTPGDPLPFAVNRHDSPCSISLSNLVRLDWRHRQELFPHGPGATKLESIGVKGRAYNVESLERGAAGNKFIYLYPDKRYYVVPIYEEGQSPDAPQRFLLVRNRQDNEEPGPHIFVVEPLEPPSREELFAHLHIIGGEDYSVTTPMLHAAGIVEAILTTTALAPESSATLSESSTPFAVAPLDEDLLSCIDVLAVAQSSRPEVAKDFDAVHNKFLGYVQKRYGLENIPISLERTMFDPVSGHNAATTVNNPNLPEGVIVGVLRDGYLRDHKIVREANVIVNTRTGSTDAVIQPANDAQTTPQPLAPLEAKPQEPEKPDDDLLCCIDNFTQAIGYRPAIEQDVTPLRNCLLEHLRRKYYWELIPVVLNTTQFDAEQGHSCVGTAYLSKVGDGVIVAVQGNGYTSAGKVVRDAQVIVNCVPSRVVQLNKLVPLSRQQTYLEIVARQDMIIDEVIHDTADQLGIIDVIYSLLAIFVAASPPRIRYLAEQLNNGKATSSLIRENLGRTPPLHLRYLRRTPEIYVVLRGEVKPLDTLRQILVSEAAQRGVTNYYLQTNRFWLNDLLHQLRPEGPTIDDCTAFANYIAMRLTQITFTPTFPKLGQMV